MVRVLCYLLLFVSWSRGRPSENYLHLRQNLIEEEKRIAFGGNLTLSGDEILANECLMAAKWKEVDEAFENPSKFLPAKNFLQVREEIEKSEVFRIIRKMPKGGNFHAHSSAMANLNFVLRNATREPNLYLCQKPKKLRLQFFDNPDDTCNWELLEDLRQNDTTIDEKLEEYIKLLESRSNNIDDIWEKFEAVFKVIKGVVKFRPFFEQYLNGAMQELYDDNVMFLEVHTSLSTLYEMDGTYYDPVNVTRIYKEISERFVKEHPGFLGIKIIYSPYRKASKQDFDRHVERFKRVRAAYADFVVGFDLVGQEDKGYPLINFAKELEELGKNTSFFFHAGETNWYGHSTDQNLYDAVLLNTKRIGHGLALLKHPKLMELVKKKNIAIELNPISNQVLKYVEDMRSHPASYFYAENFPFVVSNDDPSLWGVRGLSYDFYETFVGIMSRDADLRALKQLAINSIVFSSFTEDEKKQASEIFKSSWQSFISELIVSPECTDRNTVANVF